MHVPGFYVGSGVLNSRPHACMASTVDGASLQPERILEEYFRNWKWEFGHRVLGVAEVNGVFLTHLNVTVTE